MVNSESPQRPDLQDLVAYIQGRGSEAMRAQVLKRLDEDEAYMDLMLDLVPMLREAGECGDPDAEAEPAPAPLRLAPPPVEVAPAVAEPPAGGKVIAAPDRFRRPWGKIAAVAALVPVAVGIWLTSRTQPLNPQKLAQKMVPDLRAGLDTDNPFDPTMRSANEPGSRNDDFVLAGTHLLDLERALSRHDLEAASQRLLRLESVLDPITFASSFRDVATYLGKPPVDWSLANNKVTEAYRFLVLDDKESALKLKTGICWRAAYLAAEAKDESFFKSGRQRERCRDLVGKGGWVANPKTVENAFFAIRSTQER